MSNYQTVRLRNGAEVSVGDHLLVMKDIPLSDFTEELDTGTTMKVDQLTFDDERFETGLVIIWTENHGWIHCDQLANLMAEDRILVSVNR
ncbi:hypothetical protein HUG10_20160 (plasmid) [Halorarum halophilum]|uniref:Uncharacterized protein n=1 Tax=Halorarum halophilum TaxID=2743090 RepID=A0A7D5KPW9_9EURY|nr:hypothetical protein [Halobaculum halophilum]QLG29922.1 hypothetical protein HUG10_20160 [Halobaculum halophilum]